MDYLLPFIGFWALSAFGVMLTIGGFRNAFDDLNEAHERAWGFLLGAGGILFSIAAAMLAVAAWGA